MKIICVFLVLLTTLIDQSSKEYLRPILQNGNIIKISTNIRLVNAWNPGISFGMFKSLTYNKIILSISSLLIISVLLFLIYRNQKNKLLSFALSIVVGGALGNLIDRLNYGAVYDFIDLYVYDWHWPTFNMADSFIVLGSLLIILEIYIKAEKSVKLTE